MNKFVLNLKKKENTKKLKYESLLEENKSKNEKIINLLYERAELLQKNEELEERVNNLEEKCAELMHELKLKEMKKRVKKND